MQFIHVDEHGQISSAGAAPYLDYRAIRPDEYSAVESRLQADWLRSDLERQVVGHVAEQLAVQHLDEVRQRTWALLDKTASAVKKLEIAYWDNRANMLAQEEQAGKRPKDEPDEGA